MGVAPYSSLKRVVKSSTSASGTSSPGHPYHWNLVVFAKPLRPVTRPPEDMLKLYVPSSERLMVIGRRLETRRRRPEPSLVACTAPRILTGAERDYSLINRGLGSLRRSALLSLKSYAAQTQAQSLVWRLQTKPREVLGGVTNIVSRELPQQVTKYKSISCYLQRRQNTSKETDSRC